MENAHIEDVESHAVIGAAIEVHRELRSGFLEAVYREALAIELAERRIPYRMEVALPVEYKGCRLRARYRADFVCFDGLIVECKAIASAGPTEFAQVLNYVRVCGLQRALLLNFGSPRLQFHRLINRNASADA